MWIFNMYYYFKWREFQTYIIFFELIGDRTQNLSAASPYTLPTRLSGPYTVYVEKGIVVAWTKSEYGLIQILFRHVVNALQCDWRD